MLNKLLEFYLDESGAVTVDWVVLTAGVVGLGGLVYFYMNEPIEKFDEEIGSALASVEVPDITFD